MRAELPKLPKFELIQGGRDDKKVSKETRRIEPIDKQREKVSAVLNQRNEYINEFKSEILSEKILLSDIEDSQKKLGLMRLKELTELLTELKTKNNGISQENVSQLGMYINYRVKDIVAAGKESQIQQAEPIESTLNPQSSEIHEEKSL